MIQEFKEFIMKGNVLELAVAVIIAGAFGAVVNSFVNDIIMPPIGMAIGGVSFEDLALVLKPAEVLADGTVKEAVSINYGRWINTIINFLIIAFVLFMIIRSYNKMNPPAPAPEPGPSELDLLKEIRDALRR